MKRRIFDIPQWEGRVCALSISSADTHAAAQNMALHTCGQRRVSLCVAAFVL